MAKPDATSQLKIRGCLVLTVPVTDKGFNAAVDAGSKENRLKTVGLRETGGQGASCC